MKIQVLVGPTLALSPAAGPGWSQWIDPTPIQVNSGSEQHGQRVVPVDLDGDLDLDAITASYEGHSVNWWRNDMSVLGIFQDGFETGDLSAWSSSSP